MPTEEELKAAEEAKRAAEAAEKAKADEAAKKAAEEEAAKKQASFEEWLKGQPEDVRKKYDEHVGGLKKALDSEREKSKGSAAALKKVAELEEAEKKRKEAEMTELQKAQAKLAELEGQLQTEKLARMRQEAATAAKLPAEFAERLKGETPEDLKADAEKVAETLKKIQKPGGPPVNPTNPNNNSENGETDAQRRQFLLGGIRKLRYSQTGTGGDSHRKLTRALWRTFCNNRRDFSHTTKHPLRTRSTRKHDPNRCCHQPRQQRRAARRFRWKHHRN